MLWHCRWQPDPCQKGDTSKRTSVRGQYLSLQPAIYSLWPSWDHGLLGSPQLGTRHPCPEVELKWGVTAMTTNSGAQLHVSGQSYKQPTVPGFSWESWERQIEEGSTADLEATTLATALSQSLHREAIWLISSYGHHKHSPVKNTARAKTRQPAEVLQKQSIHQQGDGYFLSQTMLLWGTKRSLGKGPLSGYSTLIYYIAHYKEQYCSSVKWRQKEQPVIFSIPPLVILLWKCGRTFGWGRKNY